MYLWIFINSEKEIRMKPFSKITSRLELLERCKIIEGKWKLSVGIHFNKISRFLSEKKTEMHTEQVTIKYCKAYGIKEKIFYI